MSLEAYLHVTYKVAPIIKDGSALLVLLRMADEVGRDGRGCFISTQTLADDTGLSRRTVCTKLAQLTERGVIRKGDQRMAEYIQAGYRPIVYDIDLTWGADDMESSCAKIAHLKPVDDDSHRREPTPLDTIDPEQPTPDAEPETDMSTQSGTEIRCATGVQQVCKRCARGVHSVCTQPSKPLKPSKPRGGGGARETHATAAAEWEPVEQETLDLIDELKVDLKVELKNFRAYLNVLAAKGQWPDDVERTFRNGLHRANRDGFLAKRTTRQSDHKPPLEKHKHHADCEHVYAALADVESEYDHTSPTEFGDTSEWAFARQAKAEELNRQETIA